VSQNITVAKLLVRKFSERGIKTIFGLPGGGSSLDIINAAGEENIDFVLTKTENSAVMMAGAMAESSGVPGVALMTKGPGVTNSANGVAYASLDRAPVIVLTDGFTPKQLSYITHQVFDQAAVLRPIVKATSRLESPDPEAEIDALFNIACTAPMGPVHIELTSEAARRVISIDPAKQSDQTRSDPRLKKSDPFEQLDDTAVGDLRAYIETARKPVVVLGLEAREHSQAVREFVVSLGCPVLLTYKAKGVVSDTHPQAVGIFTGGALEEEVVKAADLIILVGMDPVELILQPWRYEIPVVDIAAFEHSVHYVKPKVRAVGSISSLLQMIKPPSGWDKKDWSQSDFEAFRSNAHRLMAYRPIDNAVAPDRVAQLAASVCGEIGIKPRFSIDAGAHMFSVAAFFPAHQPGDVLVSNGLATMAFALPAAISAAVQLRGNPVLCFTGDGGLMMCLGELCTAVEQRAHVIVIVFNDSSLSLIDIKQQSRSFEPQGVRWSHHNFSATMSALGGLGFSVSSELEFVDALKKAIANDGPSLIDVLVDPSGYPEQLKALRG
jgi:acetolactate synthase-1/2/3 large subunit